VSVSYSQFVPGPNPISAPVVTAQTLSSGTGEVTSTGSVTVGGGTNSITLGTAIGQTYSLSNSGILDQTGTGRALRNNVNTSTITIRNFATGLIRSNNSDTFQIAQPGTSITLENSGQIISLNRDNTGGDQAIDWNAIATGANSLTNLATGVIRANAADAVRPGRNGVITNFGLIEATPVLEGRSVGSSDGIDAQTLSGIVVDNSGTIRGRHAIAGGDNVFTITVTNRSGGLITGVNGSGVNIDGPTTTSAAFVTNLAGGVITGTTDAISANGDGDGVDVDGVLTLINAGTIQGLGAKGVDSSGLDNNTEGVAAGGGTIINLAGGVILGQALTGNLAREGRGILVDDGLGGAGVATTTVINAGTIRGFSGFAVKLVGNFADLINNQAGGVIRGAGTGAAIQMGDGNDQLINSGLIQGDNGLAIDLQGGNDTLLVTGGAASILGKIDGGTGTNTATFSPGAGQSFSYAGEIANFASVIIESGTVTFSGHSTYLGPTTIRPSALLALFGTISGSVANAGFFKGTGVVNGNVVNSGTVAPGASVGQLTVKGNYTQTQDGTLQINASSAEDFSKLVVNGNATIGGTLVVVPLKGFKAQFGQQLSSFLQANNVSGYFSTIKVPPGFRGRVEENHGDLSLLFAPASYTQVAQNQNQANVATALDQFIPATSGDRLVVSTALDHLFASEYPDAFDAILPAFYQTVSSIGLTLVNTQSQLIDQRLDAIRIGADRGFSVQGLGNNVPIYKESAVDGESRVDAKKSVITSTLEDTHWGAWVMGSGIFGRNYSVQDLPNYRFSSGQFLAGADHRWNKYFSTGLFAGYQGAYATYPESGRVWMNGVTFGIYATFDARNGFYASTIVSGSYSNYSTRRSIEFGTIDRTARGDLDSGSVGTFLKVGYDFKVGGFTFGPVLSAIYRKRSGESEFAGWTAKSQQLATQRRWKTRIYVECFRGQNSFDSTGENVLEP
jgi:hypothetical protein